MWGEGNIIPVTKQKERKKEIIEWNNIINDEIARLYQIRTNIILLYYNNGVLSLIEEVLEPEIQSLIAKLKSLRR